jgi:voltage-gated potassium channel
MRNISKIRNRLYIIIFEADTRAGKFFDQILLAVILISIFLVMLDSISSVREKHLHLLRALEWTITVIFTIEYFARIWVVDKPLKYIFSFYGLIDLFAVIPTYLGLIFVGGQSLIVIRALRLLRVFRIMKLSRYSRAGRLIAGALWQNKEKIGIFVTFVVTIAIIVGTFMYLIEGEENGFKNIPISIYWAIVTLTTVGYGDLAPTTGLGQFLATLVMILGYSIIAVPTGIVTASLLSRHEIMNTQVCSNCMFDKHEDDAQFCKKCGTSLDMANREKR